MYCRDGNFDVELILEHIIDEPRSRLSKRFRGKKAKYREYVTKSFNGHPVKMDSLRYQTFKAKGVVCISCGVVGLYFGLEMGKTLVNCKQGPSWHFNLYAVDDHGKEIMMTKDHILARSNGGLDIIENMQPMCTVCNCIKGSKIV